MKGSDMAQKSGEKFVVLHSVISHGGRSFDQGQAIDRKDLVHTHETQTAEGKKQEQIDAAGRLLQLRAIRPASAEEVNQTRVDVSGVPLALSPLAQAELAARDATIERLTRL